MQVMCTIEIKDSLNCMLKNIFSIFFSLKMVLYEFIQRDSTVKQ